MKKTPAQNMERRVESIRKDAMETMSIYENGNNQRGADIQFGRVHACGEILAYMRRSKLLKGGEREDG